MVECDPHLTHTTVVADLNKQLKKTFLLFRLEIGLEFFPDRLCAFGRAYEECLIPFVG